MIRPFTCLCLLISAGSGLYLYSAKHDAQMLDREITRLGKQAQESRGRAALMRAEYDRLGDPDRLRELASQVLALQPTDPTQFAAMADVEKRLVAVGATIQTNIGAPVEPPQVLASIVDLPPRAPVVPLAVVAARPSPEKWVTERPVPPIQIAAARPFVASPRPAPAPTPLAIVAPPPAQIATPPSVLAQAQPASPAVQMARAPLVRQAAAETRPAPRPSPAPASVPVRAVAPDAPAPMAAPVFASALGMARTQAPLPANALTQTSYTPGGSPMVSTRR